MIQSYPVAPLPVSDIGLDGEWFIIQPEATTNLIANPSPQIAINGVTQNGIATMSATQARRGRFSALIAPSNVNCRHEDTVTGLTIGQVYSFSRDLYADAGYQFEIRIVSGATTYAKPIIATGRWQRISVSGVATGTSLVCTIAVVGHTKQFYLDGAQLESKAYPTTYCDGNVRGFNAGDYAWAGVAYSSISTRNALASHGGHMFAFSELGMIVKAVIGLAYIAMTPMTTPLTTGGATVNAINQDVTAFSLSLQYPELRSEPERARLMSQTRRLLCPSPLATGRVQPSMLRYRPSFGDDVSIPCYWDGDPIEQGLWPNSQVTYNFTMYLPMMLGLNRVAVVDPQTAITATPASDATLMQRRRDTFTWRNLVSAASASGLNGIYAIEPRRGGGIYVGSELGRYFGSTAGVDNGIKGIVQFDGTTWSNVGANASNGTIHAIATDASGSIYVGGQHSNLAPLSPNISRWDGLAWQVVSSGANGLVRAIAIGFDGLVYVGGDFTTIGGVATRGIAVYNPQTNTFSAMGTGLAVGGYVNTIAISPRGFVYIGGSFTGVGGVANTAHIGVWNIRTSAWESLGNVTGVAPEVFRILFNTRDNRVYVGGIFSAINSVNSNGLIVWNGAQWLPISTSLTNVGSVYTLEFDQDGLLYIGGQFLSNIQLPNTNLVRWDGNTILPADIYPATLASGKYNQNVKNCMLVRSTADGLYVAHWENGVVYTPPPTMNTQSATVITNTSTITNSPIIKITGSPTATALIYGLVNYTTGRWIYAVGVLQPNEVLTINTMQGQVSIVSSLFGSQLYRVANGSDVPLWNLVPGQNIIGFLTDRTDVTVTIEYQEAFGSLDDSVWKAGR